MTHQKGGIMAKAKVTQIPKTKQEAVPDLAKLFETLFELSEHFNERIRPHEDNLHKLNGVLCGDFIFRCRMECWRDLDYGMACALDETTRALYDFQERLKSAFRTYREQPEAAT